MEEAGDSDITVSAWTLKGDDYTRTIEYSHPVNVPLAPPRARARKEQRYRRYGDRGISIETDTYVDDVPMTDCFYVTDRLLVASNGNNDGNDGKRGKLQSSSTTVSAQFDIRFVKSTIFRAIIANTTRTEFLKMYQSYFDQMRNCLGESTATAQPAVTQTIVKEVLPAGATVNATILYGLVGLVLLLQIFLMRELFAVKDAILRTEVQQEMLAFQMNEEMVSKWCTDAMQTTMMMTHNLTAATTSIPLLQ